MPIGEPTEATWIVPQKSLRLRVNVDISVKGVHTWSTTVDGEGYTQEEILERSDALVKALEARYPIAGAP